MQITAGKEGSYFLKAGYIAQANDVSFNDHLKLNEWVHLALTKRENNIDLYVNSKFAGNASIADHVIDSTKLKFGWNGSSHGGGEVFHGAIDDIRIYNRALSEAEVATLYFLEKVRGEHLTTMRTSIQDITHF